MLLIFFLLEAFLWEHGIADTTPARKPGIVPKSQTKGIDFCGVDKYYYIIRSDLGCYMRSTNFHEGNELKVYSLHNSVRGGDHYLANKDDFFYIIKGNTYRRVDNLNKDTAAATFSLHLNCQKGDHYFSAGGYFYIIFKRKGIYRRVTNLNKDSDARTFLIPEGLKGGLYYWGTADYAYLVKPNEQWGIEYYRTSNFDKNSDPKTYSFHASVVNFIPGGISITHGVSFGLWNLLTVIINDLSTSVSKEHTFTRRIGYEKEKTESIEHHWSISVESVTEPGALAKTLVKEQFSLKSEYGGMKMDTSTEKWSDAVEITDKITFTVAAKTTVYAWQYTLGLGKESICYPRDALAFTETAQPPSLIPFQPTND